MQFRLLKTLVRSLRCEELQDCETAVDELRYSPVYSDERPKEFAVIYDLKLPLESTNQLIISYLAIFETAEAITEEFKNSHFPKVNAAAVAYPYLRAFVSQFTALAGFEPQTLPIRNFVKTTATTPAEPKPESPEE